MSTSIRAGDLSVNYELTGPREGPVVVLSHSLGTDLRLWDPQIESLGRELRVLRYDLRGHGATRVSGPESYRGASMDRYAADVVALMDALEIERAKFVGLSVSGMIGQCLAAKAPGRIEAIVLGATGNRIGTADMWDQRIATIEREGMASIADSIAARSFTAQAREGRPELMRFFHDILIETPPEGYIACARAIRDADLRAVDAQIRCSTLVVTGSEDVATPPSMGAELRDAIPGAQMIVIDNAPHIIPAEMPEAFTKAILDFFRAAA